MSDRVNAIVTVPNALSTFRLAGVPLLYPLAFGGRTSMFVTWFLLLGVTDFLDGKIARYLKQSSSFGALMDSVADIAYYFSGAFFVIMLFPQYLIPNLGYFGAFLVVFAGATLFPFLKFGKMIFIHTALLRFNAVLVFATILLCFVVDTTLLIRVLLIMFYVGYVEVFALFILYGPVSPDTRSIIPWLWAGKPRVRS